MSSDQEELLARYDKFKELEQEKLLLMEINDILVQQINELRTGKSSMGVDKGREIEQENIILTEIARQLEEKEVKLDDFFPNLSHELRTRLVPAKAYLEMLSLEKFGKINEVQSKKLAVVKDSIFSLSQFITNILTSTKIEMGQFVFSRKNCDLGKIITNTLSMLNLQISKSGTKIIFKDPQMVVLCDEGLLVNVFTNLIQNSLNAIGDGGEIEISIIDDKKEILVTIRDTGKGIAKEHVERIFDKFYRTDRSLSCGGLGFGLYFCKQIISIHGGKIWASSEIGTGTSIHFTLPKSSSDF